MPVEDAWTCFHERMGELGGTIVGPDFPTDPRARAEGYRYLARLQEFALQWYLEFSDPRHPAFFRFGDDVLKWGATNADNHYLRAKVEASGSYRIVGNVAGVKELLVSLHDGEMALGRAAVLEERSLQQLRTDADGTLEIVLGGERSGSNWLPLDESVDLVLVRQFVADWEHDAVAELRIERADEAAAEPPPQLTPEGVAAALDLAATWVEASVPFWNGYSLMMQQFMPANTVTPPTRPQGAAENMLVGGCCFDLAEDDALVFETEVPNGTYWSMGLSCLSWFENLDFGNRVTSLNDNQLHVDQDGRVRVVLSHQDPGVQNWLDASGHRQGLLGYRFVNATDAPVPTGLVVKLADLAEVLPADTPAFSSASRHRQLAARRAGVSRRFRR